MSTVRLAIDDDAVATIILERPEVLNATNLELARDLGEVVKECESNESMRSVVLAGAGRSFCAGIDLNELAEGTLSDQFYVEWDSALWRLERLGRPVVAAIWGHCVGSGLQLAVTADARVSGANAKFAMPAAVEGLVPGLSIHRLPRLIGQPATRRLVLFGQVWGASVAKQNGLVDEYVFDTPIRPFEYPPQTPDQAQEEEDQGAVLARAKALAREAHANSGTNGFAVCKQLLSLQNEPVPDLFDEYLRLQQQCQSHPDHLQALENWKTARQGGIPR